MKRAPAQVVRCRFLSPLGSREIRRLSKNFQMIFVPGVLMLVLFAWRPASLLVLLRQQVKHVRSELAHSRLASEEILRLSWRTGRGVAK